MVFKNLRLVFSIVGILKVATVILGIISVALISHAYEKSVYNNGYRLSDKEDKNESYSEPISKETFYLAVAVMWCVLSLGYLLRYLLTQELENTYGDKVFDMVFHILGGVLILIGSCLVFSSASNIDKLKEYYPYVDRLQYKGEKFAASIFGLANSVIHFFIAGMLFFRKPNTRT